MLHRAHSPSTSSADHRRYGTRLLVAMLLLSSAFVVGQVRAADDASAAAPATATPLRRPTSLTLEDSVVVATSSSREIFDTPYVAYLLDDSDIQLRLQPKSLPDALKDIPGVHMQKTGHGMVSPFMRGWTAQRVVLLTDGIRLNNSYLRDGPNEYWMLVDGYTYSDLEVLMGPASVLYGSDAIGGVVNARSGELPRGEAGSGFTWQGGQADFRWSSAEESFSEHIQGTATIDDMLTVKLGLTRRAFGTLHTGDDVTNPNTDYEEWGGNLRAAYHFDADHTLTFGYDHMDRDDINRVHRTTEHQDFEGSSTLGSTSDLYRLYDYDYDMVFTRYSMREGEGFLSEMDLTLSYQNFREAYHRIRKDGRESFRDATIHTLGAAIRLESPSDFGTWTYGADWYRDWAETGGRDISKTGKVTTLTQGSVADDATYDLFGVYLQNELPLGERFELITGLRYTYAALNANDVTGIPEGVEGNWSALTGSVRLLYHAMPNGQLNLYGGVSQGFHAPNLSDATRDDEFGGGTEKPSADLDAERFTTWELGAKSRGTWGYAQVAAYYTQVHDLIGRWDSPEPAKRNMDSGYVQGIEANAGYNVSDEWQVFGRIAWQEGSGDAYQDRDVTQAIVQRPQSRMLPLSGQIGVHYEPAGLPIWLETYVDLADRQDRLTDAEKSDNRFPPGGTPGYAVWSVRGGWQINKSLDLTLTAENLTDEEYRVHGSGINENGRGVIASLRAKF